MTFGDETDQKIISILKYGERQQSEIIKLIDKNESTIRRHLDYLEEEFDLSHERRGNKVYYYLEDEREIIPPKPYADSEEVTRVLYNINQNLTPSEDLNTSTQEDLLTHMLDFSEYSSKYYYVVGVDQNISTFFDIFDHVINDLENSGSSESLFHPREFYYFCISASNDLYSNWEIGKENKEYHRLLFDRIDDIHSIIGHSPKNIERAAQTLLFSVSNKEGQKAFVNMAGSGRYNSKELLNGPIYAYNQKNDLDKLIDDLDDIEKKIEDSEFIQEMTKDIKNRFIRSFDGM